MMVLTSGDLFIVGCWHRSLRAREQGLMGLSVGPFLRERSRDPRGLGMPV